MHSSAYAHVQSARLVMRKPCDADVGRLFEIFGDPATNTFNPSGPHKSRADSEAFLARWKMHWEKTGFGDWAICLKSAPERIIGFGGLSYAMFGEEERINLGYRFATEAWGQGIASEFADAAVLAGFQLLHLDRIYARVRENHLASRRVLEKAGMQPVELLADPRGVSSSVIYEIKRPSLEIYA